MAITIAVHPINQGWLAKFDRPSSNKRPQLAMNISLNRMAGLSPIPKKPSTVSVSTNEGMAKAAHTTMTLRLLGKACRLE